MAGDVSWLTDIGGFSHNLQPLSVHGVTVPTFTVDRSEASSSIRFSSCSRIGKWAETGRVTL